MEAINAGVQCDPVKISLSSSFSIPFLPLFSFPSANNIVLPCWKILRSIYSLALKIYEGRSTSLLFTSLSPGKQGFSNSPFSNQNQLIRSSLVICPWHWWSHKEIKRSVILSLQQHYSEENIRFYYYSSLSSDIWVRNGPPICSYCIWHWKAYFSKRSQNGQEIYAYISTLKPGFIQLPLTLFI